MRCLRLVSMFVVAAAMLLVLSQSDVDAQQKGKKGKKGNKGGTFGAITKVDSSNKDAVQLTIKSGGKKGDEAKEVKVTLSKDTKIEKVTGSKKDKTQQTSTASVSDLEVGKFVVIRKTKGADTVERVLLVDAKKKKKAAE